MRRHLRFVTAAVGAATMSVVAMAPAIAAAPVSQARANAVQLSVAGNAQGSGDATAKNDGNKETKTGQETPPLSVLGGQQLITAGVLAQQATARSNSTSAACAGLAGDGGSVVNIGGSSCLEPGDQLNATLGELDLSGLIVANPGSALEDLNQVTAPILTQLTPVINQVVTQLRAQFGDLGLVAGLGAVEGRCTAEPGSANGDATLTDVQLRIVLPEQAPQSELVLLNLPVHPKPNTHLTTDLSDVLDMIAEALRTNLNTALDGAGAPLNALIDAFQENIVTAVRDQVEGNLAPLEKDLLDIMLNRQSRDGDAIEVSALDLTVLPVLGDQIDAALANLQIGNADCASIARTVAKSQAAPPKAKAKGLPAGVSAGYATMPDRNTRDDDHTTAIALGAFALLMTAGAGFVTVRRLRG